MRHWNFDDIPGDGKILRRVEIIPHDGDRHGEPLRAPHLAHGVEERNVFRRLTIDFEDAIAGLKTGAVGRGILDGDTTVN